MNMRLYFRKSEHKITIISEFMPDKNSEKLISKLSQYIYKIVDKKDLIITELQSVPAGYRLTYTITFYTNYFSRNKYTRELSKLSDWLYNDDNCYGLISKYHYNYT